MQFNFTRLHGIFSQVVSDHRTTLAFEVQSGIGRFVFMMFLAEEDAWKEEKRLFIFLGRTQRLLSPYKLYGNQKSGSFLVYLRHADEDHIKEELGINGGNHPFDLERFLEQLNQSIPDRLIYANQVATLRRNNQAFVDNQELRDHVDEPDKTILIGPRRLPAHQSPQEKTLRKLSLYVEADPRAADELLTSLRNRNTTLCWADDPNHPGMGFNQLVDAV